MFLSELQVPAPVEETDRQRMLTHCNTFVVEARQLQCSEYCFKIPCNCFQHPKYSANTHELSTVIKALGSSVGGVVILSREPGRTDCVANLLAFKERLETLLSEDSSWVTDMLHIVQLPEDTDVWGLVLVKASLPTDLSSPATIDEAGLVVNRRATLTLSSNGKSNTASNSSTTSLTRAGDSAITDSRLRLTAPVPPPRQTLTESEIHVLLWGKVSWTTHKSNWEKHVVVDRTCSLESNVRKYGISSRIFIPSDPIEFTPSHLLKALLSQPSERNRVIDAIKVKLDSTRAFAIVSPSWLSHIGKEKAAQRPTNHVMDILLVTENGTVYLWTIVKHANMHDELHYTYMTIAGRLTKFLLLKKQTDKRMLKVNCYCYSLQDSSVMEPRHQQYTESFFVNNIGLKQIQNTLAENIVTRETYLKNVIGEACGYKLSAEQWQIAEQGTRAPVMVISGPPGSGKTLLCSYFLREKGSKKDSLYVCTTDALGAFMESQNICLVHVVQTEAELTAMIQSGDYDNKTSIAFDDAHRFSCSENTIGRLLELVRSKPDVRLYVFYDDKFQCFDEIKKPFPEMVTRCCARLKIDCAFYPLAEVHRNTRRVMSFLSAVSFKGDIKCQNKWEGDDVEVVEAENPLDDSDDNILARNIRLALGLNDLTASRLHYAAKDIAVLIDTDSPNPDVWRCRQMLREYIPDVDIHSATTFPRTGIVVDCLDSFHGLDAGVCFYVLSSGRVKERDTRSIYNPKYLAFLASRAIHKAVFLVPKLDAKVFREMLFDCFGDKVIIPFSFHPRLHFIYYDTSYHSFFFSSLNNFIVLPF